MRVFYTDLTTGETLEVVRNAGTAQLEAPTFIHQSGAWGDQLRTLWAEKHIGPGPYDYPTLVATCPPVVHGDNEMECGDQKFYQVPDCKSCISGKEDYHTCPDYKECT